MQLLLKLPFYFLRSILRALRDLDGMFIFLSHKLIYQAKLAPKYKIGGQCKRRGICCNKIAVLLAPKYAHWHWLKKCTILYYEFVYNFKFRFFEPEHSVLVFKCHYLKNNGQCGIYKRRPYICRNYPNPRLFEKPEFLPGCGYFRVKN